MPLYTNLALYDTSPKLENPLNAMMNREQLQAARSTNALNALKLTQEQQAAERQNALLGRLKGLDINAPEAAQAYTEAGLGNEYGKIREQNAKADLEASNLIDKNLARFRSFAPQVKDVNGVKSYLDAMYKDKVLGKMAADMKPYEQALQENIDLFQKDPIQWQVAHANLTGPQVLDTYKQTQAKQDLGGTVQTTTLDAFGRPIGAPVSTPKTATPDALLADARAKAAQNLLERKFAYEKANPGYTVQEAGDGSLIAVNKNNPKDVQPVSMGGVPVQGKVAPSPENFVKSDIQLANLADSVKSFKDEVLKKKSTTGAYAPTGEDTAALKSKYQALLMRVKDLYQLGALSGPDMDIIEGQISNPASWSGKFVSSKGILEQIKTLEDMTKNSAQNLESAYGLKPKATTKALQRSSAAPGVDTNNPLLK